MAGQLKPIERAEYESRLQRDLEFVEMAVIRQAEIIGVSRETLAKWRDEIGTEKIVEWAVKLYQREFPVVASALLKRIKKTGDPAACELWMARFEGWLKRSEVHHTVQTEPIIIHSPSKMLEHFDDAAALNGFINTCRAKLEQLALKVGVGYFPASEPINLSIESLGRMVSEGRFPREMSPNDPKLSPERLQRHGFDDGRIIDVTPVPAQDDAYSAAQRFLAVEEKREQDRRLGIEPEGPSEGKDGDSVMQTVMENDVDK